MKGLIGLVVGMTIGGAIGGIVVKRIIDKDIVVVKGEDGELYDVPLSDLDTEKVYQEIGDVKELDEPPADAEDPSIREGTMQSPNDDGDDERNISM